MERRCSNLDCHWFNVGPGSSGNLPPEILDRVLVDVRPTSDSLELCLNCLIASVHKADEQGVIRLPVGAFDG